MALRALAWYLAILSPLAARAGEDSSALLQFQLPVDNSTDLDLEAIPKDTKTDLDLEETLGDLDLSNAEKEMVKSKLTEEEKDMILKSGHLPHWYYERQGICMASMRVDDDECLDDGCAGVPIRAHRMTVDIHIPHSAKLHPDDRLRLDANLHIRMLGMMPLPYHDEHVDCVACGEECHINSEVWVGPLPCGQAGNFTLLEWDLPKTFMTLALFARGSAEVHGEIVRGAASTATLVDGAELLLAKGTDERQLAALDVHVQF